MTPVGRYRALDGLRGIGAFVVVVYHCLLVVPAISAAFVIKGFTARQPAPGSVEWWLYRTPLRILWAGHEAVLVFFVLSGFVLTLPLLAAHRGGQWWRAYYVRRLARLYLPVIAALLLAFALARVFTRDTSAGSSWLRSHRPPTPADLMHDMGLLLGTTNLDSPLWSLRWEVAFSLLLPVMFWLLGRFRVQAWWRPAILVLACLSAVAGFQPVKDALPLAFLSVGLLQYMPVFAIGMVLAMNVAQVRASTRRLIGVFRGRLARVVLIAIVVTLTTSPTLLGSGEDGYTAVDAVTTVVSLLGVALIVCGALESSRMQHLLTRAPVQWAGSRSFSIYLVHEPVVVSAALLTHAAGYRPWLLVACLVVPLALVFAEAFYRAVEHPAHLLSQWLGRRVSGPPPTGRRVEVTPGPAAKRPGQG